MSMRLFPLIAPPQSIREIDEYQRAVQERIEANERAAAAPAANPDAEPYPLAPTISPASSKKSEFNGELYQRLKIVVGKKWAAVVMVSLSVTALLVYIGVEVYDRTQK